jgi:hypothetical protein
MSKYEVAPGLWIGSEIGDYDFVMWQLKNLIEESK